MCYGNPDKLLSQVLAANPMVANQLGHTPTDDFEHFCAITGLDEAQAGHGAFAWAKCAFIMARLQPQHQP